MREKTIMEKRLNSNLLKESFLSDFFKEKLNDNNT